MYGSLIADSPPPNRVVQWEGADFMSIDLIFFDADGFHESDYVFIR